MSVFWQEEMANRRMADYRCRFLSWKFGRKVMHVVFEPHWLHQPLFFDDNGEAI